jgi:hypothetical protein
MCMDEYTKRNDPVWEMASDHGDVKFLLVSKPAELSASGKWRAPKERARFGCSQENNFDAVKIVGLALAGMIRVWCAQHM